MSTVNQELAALSSMQASNLTARTTTISLPSDKLNINLSDYFNDSNIIAVDGYKEGVRHFCLLVGEVPGGGVPDPEKHIVQQFHYKNIIDKEANWPRNEAMPGAWPAELAGFAMLQLNEKEDQAQPITLSPTGQYQELNEKNTKYIGNIEGGVLIGKDGNTEIITGDGSTVSFGEYVDLGKKKPASTDSGFTNWLLVKNGFRDGSWLGAPVPNVLPLVPLTYDPFPNIPGIAELFLKVKMWKNLVNGIRELAEEVSD